MEDCFKNVQFDEIYGMLTEPEIRLVQEVICEYKPKRIIGQDKGSFIMVGQKREEPAREILRLNLCNGKAIIGKSDEPECLYSYTSDRAVESAIDELLLYPRKSLSDDYKQLPANFGQLASYMYYVGEPKAHAIVVNTTYGRFLASIYTGVHDTDMSILACIVSAIATMTDNDKIMLKSVERIEEYIGEVSKSLHDKHLAFLLTATANLERDPTRMFFE